MSSTSPAVGRALDVLLYLAGRAGPAPGAVIARDLAIPRSSTYHMLQVLVDRGFVVFLPEQRTYGLGVAAFEIGTAYLRRGPLELLARPILQRLAIQVQATAHLGILHGAETLYLLKERQPSSQVPVTLVTDVGVRLPAHLTANGRSILAHLPAAQVRAVFPSSRSFVDRTGRGPTSLPELRRILTDERRQGWSREDGLISVGMESVAACAFDHPSWPFAAISVTWRAERATIPVETLVRAVRFAADQLTTALSGRAPAPSALSEEPSGRLQV